MKIAISAESTCDLTKELLQEYNIETVPFSVILGSESYLDGVDVDAKKVFDYVEETKQLPKTSAVNQFQYEDYFSKLKKEKGYDAIIHITLSSGITSAIRNAELAAQEVGNVYVIDSKSLSTGIALLAIYAAELVREGKDVKEIVELVSSRINAVQASFVIQHVDYLYKGGRCSKIAFLGANIFHICPQIIVQDGKMDAGKKYRGNFFKVVSQYVDDTLTQFDHPDLKHVFITNTIMDDKENIHNMIKEKLIKKGFKNIHETEAGCTISSHCGPNCIGILYINDK